MTVINAFSGKATSISLLILIGLSAGCCLTREMDSHHAKGDTQNEPILSYKIAVLPSDSPTWQELGLAIDGVCADAIGTYSAWYSKTNLEEIQYESGVARCPLLPEGTADLLVSGYLLTCRDKPEEELLVTIRQDLGSRKLDSTLLFHRSEGRWKVFQALHDGPLPTAT